MNNLGLIARSRGNLKLAEDHFRRVLAIHEKALGLEHPDVAGTASLLAEFYQREGQLEKAIGYQAQANDIREHELALNLVAGSERQKVLYLNQSQTDLDQMLSLLAADGGRTREGLRAGLTVVLRRKGRSLDAMADSIQTLRQRASTEDRALLDELTAAKTALAVASLQRGGVVSTTPLGKRIAALEVNIERLEAKISARSVEFRVQTQPITLEAIQKALPPDATLVEYAVFHPFDPKVRRLGAPHYGVFVLGSKGEPQWADLGDAQVIELAVDALRRAL
ncbi:MAG TPA: tetratricopeptide repeat protein, partial [Acidobacteriota bacterium]|nr:tetratricopeptide repeat protein [Acidobacteriota bacterium]